MEKVYNIVLLVGTTICTALTWAERANPMIGAFDFIVVICGWIVLGFELGRYFQQEFPRHE